METLLRRPVTKVDGNEGIYVDEEGMVFELADKGETKLRREGGELEQLLAASLKNGRSSGKPRTHALQRPTGRRRKKAKEVTGAAQSNEKPSSGAARGTQESLLSRDSEHAETDAVIHRNLRQKLAEVRRRIDYVQKRGFNERNNHSYVTAADLAGAVGDILAEFGVVIIPRLESITYEPTQAVDLT